MATIGTDPTQAAHLLREGHIVAIPTETVYGLAANAFDEAV
jgi:L-threonylcarbamoyladenylate synthase